MDATMEVVYYLFQGYARGIYQKFLDCDKEKKGFISEEELRTILTNQGVSTDKFDLKEYTTRTTVRPRAFLKIMTMEMLEMQGYADESDCVLTALTLASFRPGFIFVHSCWGFQARCASWSFTFYP